uniref:NADH dehydrogenase subunit 5 n=1 Tax=Pulex irritans TaxID=173820 RepID=UPI0020289969|nr:NADH dehydrogenase subunit 5 [Pulex irritans]UPV72702.1 NADH dehydrogenase subunit 5 [Pulex irritans]
MIKLYLLSFLNLFMLSLICFFSGLLFLLKDLIYIIEWEIMSFNSVSMVMVLMFDWMSLLFMSFVLFISCMVVMYSEEYMIMDYNKNRFLILVLLFVFSMMMMIISPNLISILLGWDGLGLVSYCLVIYYQNVKSYNAGMLTVLMNRVGDVTLLLSIAWMLNYGGWNYLFYLKYMVNMDEMYFIMLLLMVSAMTKSAQIPFSAWLPAAMAAPTPVSALVHSSTLVTAGVYLMIRFNELLNILELKMILLLLASLTMFMSGIGANFEFDLKKIIALSTLSQLGLMMSGLSFGMPKLAFFHLLMHALFKALLFLCAGAIIHLVGDFQDIRVMGAFSFTLPLLMMIFSVANLALCGLPFLAGFYSKDMILESMSIMNFNILIYILFYISVGLTVCYSFRLSKIMFLNMMNYYSLNLIFDSFNKMLKMMYSLLILSIIFGKIMSNMMFMFPMIFIISFKLKIMVLIFMSLGIWMGMELNKDMINYKMNLSKFIIEFLGSMWFLPFMSSYFVKSSMLVGKSLLKYVDQGWLELIGSQQIYLNLKSYSMNMNLYQINMMMIFLSSLFFWVMIMLFLLVI